MAEINKNIKLIQKSGENIINYYPVTLWENIQSAPNVTGIQTDLSNHKSDKSNPHTVTISQIGAASTTDLSNHTGSTTNPHSVTASQIGADPVGSAAAVNNTLTTHVNNKSNPHTVTAAQVGADPAGSAATVTTNLNTHINNKSNPHTVTAAQISAEPIQTLVTQQEAEAGTLTTVRSWTPQRVKQAITAGASSAMSKQHKRLIATFDISGTFTIANYTDINNKTLAIGDKIDAYIVGGGAGGSPGLVVVGGVGGQGGSGGYCRLLRDFVLAASSYPIIVGAGGTSSENPLACDGGSTTAFGITADGGTQYNSVTYSPLGGSGGGGPKGNGGSQGSDGEYTNLSSRHGHGGGNINYQPVNPYDGIAYGCGGGGGGGNDWLSGCGGGSGGSQQYNTGKGRDGFRGGGGGGGVLMQPGGNGGVGGGGGGGGGNGNSGPVQFGGTGGSGTVMIYA